MSIGERIREERKKQKLTQCQLARMVGAHGCYLSMIENSHYPVKVEFLLRIANALAISMDELTGFNLAQARVDKEARGVLRFAKSLGI